MSQKIEPLGLNKLGQHNLPPANPINPEKNLSTSEYKPQSSIETPKEIMRVQAIKAHLNTTADYKESNFEDYINPVRFIGELVTINNENYQITNYIASGGMSHVYNIQEINSNDNYVIKMIKPELLDSNHKERFQREIKELDKLKHPHIVSVLGNGVLKGIPFFIMELADNGTMESKIDDLPPNEFLLNIAQLCNALNFVHQRRTIHRDIKPSNILLFKNGTAKLTDFGIAHSVLDTRITSHNVAIGTLSYMAPEQAKQVLQPVTNFELTPNVDLYAIGALLYKKFTNRLPIEEKGNDYIAYLKRIVEEIPKPASAYNKKIHPTLAGLISKLLTKEPAQRFNKPASHLAKVLQNLVTNNQVTK